MKTSEVPRLIYFLAMSVLSMAALIDSAPLTDTTTQRQVSIDRSIINENGYKNLRGFGNGKIGLALSGGGTRGLAQVGVLRAFEEAGLEIYCIAGTSMGSIIGGLYASGYSADSLKALARDIDFSALFSDSPKRQSMLFTQREERERYLFSIRFDGLKPYLPRALAVGQHLTNLLTDLTISANYRCHDDFDLLPIPFRATATDIATGELVVMDNGNLADAMRASMAFPLAFTAVERGNRHLMDGGMLNPLPVDVCRSMGADYVIAVNTTSPLLPINEIDSPVDVASQVTTIMQQSALEKQLAAADIVVTPQLEGIETFNLTLQDSLIELGYEAGRQAIEQIKKELTTNGIPHPYICKAVINQSGNPELNAIVDSFPIHPGMGFDEIMVEKALRIADSLVYFHDLRAKLIADPETSPQTIISIDGTPNRSASGLIFRFDGNTVFSDSVLKCYFSLAGTGPVALSDIYRIAQEIIARYHAEGYDLAYIDEIKYNHVLGLVTVVIDEGLLEFVDIRGNERTRSWIIKANFTMRPGEPFDTRKAEQGLAQIYATGFFERVSAGITPSDSGAHLTINVKEKKFTQLRLGAHWDDEYQGEMFAELLDDNVFGAGLQVLGHTHLSSRRNKYILSFKADRLSQTLITAGTKFYFSRLHRRLFLPAGGPDGYRIEDRLGWSVTIGQQIGRLGAFNFEYRLEKINTELTNAREENDQALSAFGISSTVETLNKFPYPDYGHRQDFLLEFSGKWLGGTYDEYTRLNSSIEAYWPIGNYLNIHSRLALGISTAPLPDIEKFYIGGLYDFSGYRTDQLNGDKYFVANFQMRFKLPLRCYLIGNFDYGNVYNDYEALRIKDFRKGYGVALSFDSPFGPCDFGYGKANRAPERFYLNIGLHF